MSDHTLKHLSRLAASVTALIRTLGSAEATVARTALRRALAGGDLAEESLRDLFTAAAERPVADPDDEDGGLLSPGAPEEVAARAVGQFRELVELNRVLLPPVLSAALRGDERLLALPGDELAELVPLWSEAARQGSPEQQEAFAGLFTLLAGRADASVAGSVSTVLRRIVLGAPASASDAALPALLASPRIRVEDRRFFRRLDLQLAVAPMQPEARSALGRWLCQREDLWEAIVGHGSRGGWRVRLRAARLLEIAMEEPDACPLARVEDARRVARHLLTDPAAEVGYIAARVLARLTPQGGLDELWEPWFAEEGQGAALSRMAAATGVLYAAEPARAEEYLAALMASPTAPALGQRSWRTALADAYEELAEGAPEAASRVLEGLVEVGDPVALERLADRLARQALRQGRAVVTEALGRRLDHALGDPQGRDPAEWAAVLAARECLVQARGRQPRTNLSLRARALASGLLQAEAPGRLLAALRELADQLAVAIRDLDAPLTVEDTALLGGRVRDAEDLVRCLYTEDLLTGALVVLAAPDQEEVSHSRQRVQTLRQDLRLQLLRQAGPETTLRGWREHALRLSARIAQCLPDDPLGRSCAPRAAGFVHLVGLPDFLRGWRDRVATQDTEAALGRALDAVLAAASPGSGDALATLLLWTPDAEAARRLLGRVSENRSLGTLERIVQLIEQLPDGQRPAEERLGDQLIALEDLLDLVLEETSFAAPRLGDALEELRKHVRTATGHERLISFMTPVRQSLEEAAEPLIVVLARDLGALARIAGEGAEHARLVALRAEGAMEDELALAAGRLVSQATLESASFEAEAVVEAESVGDAIRSGAAAGPEDRAARAESLGQAATHLAALGILVRRHLPGVFGNLLADVFDSWSALVAARRDKAAQEPTHPLLIDRFRIERLLGEGGMAYTYLARDPDLERLVTLKVMKPDVVKRPELSSLFTKEAKAIAALPPHNHVVQAYEYLDAASGPCLVIEYVDGESLVDLIPEGGFPLKRGLDLAEASAKGLHHVHRNHLAHLDIKAENVMVTREGTPKLIDFGLAQRDTAGRESTLVLGTPVYMSPEQALGRPLGPASDVYSFGVLLYELFTGEVPFDDADPREILKAHVGRPAAPMSVLRPDLPDGLVLLVADCLQKAAENRPWMVEVASRLSRIRASLQPAEGEESTLARREIAVLCAAVAGLDTESLSAQQAAWVIESFLRASGEIVNGLGGRIDATVGERVFAVFGYPRDDAQAVFHAVRAAVQIGRVVERLGGGLSVAAGVSSGQALVGKVRGDPTDATVLGAPLWRASRLADEAREPTPVLVEEASLDLVRGLMALGKRRSVRGLGRAWGVSIDGATTPAA